MRPVDEIGSLARILTTGAGQRGQFRAAAAAPVRAPHGGASGRAGGAGITVGGAVSGVFAGRDARWFITTHWLMSSRATMIRHSAARAMIVARFGIRITRGPPDGTLCAAMPCS